MKLRWKMKEDKINDKEVKIKKTLGWKMKEARMKDERHKNER